MNYISKQFIKDNILGIIAFIVLLLMIISELFIPKRTMNQTETLPIVSGDYLLNFPNNEAYIVFNDGWLSQSDTEDYRWVRQKSEFDICLADQKTMRIVGYVPPGTGVTHVSAYVNGKLFEDIDIQEEQQFVLEGSIKHSRKKGKTNSITIEFDSERVPTESDLDQRTFSALISSIEFH